VVVVVSIATVVHDSMVRLGMSLCQNGRWDQDTRLELSVTTVTRGQTVLLGRGIDVPSSRCGCNSKEKE
jgi:hypothetical protein